LRSETQNEGCILLLCAFLNMLDVLECKGYLLLQKTEVKVNMTYSDHSIIQQLLIRIRSHLARINNNMKIAAERIGTELKVFIEGLNWNKILQPFIMEVVEITLVAYIIDGEPIFHDAISSPEPDTHPSLMFCREEQSLADFNKKLKKAGYGEPHEIRIGNSRFSLRKEFTDAYILSCYNFCNNHALN
jgi:hypothetical protein